MGRESEGNDAPSEREVRALRYRIRDLRVSGKLEEAAALATESISWADASSLLRREIFESLVASGADEAAALLAEAVSADTPGEIPLVGKCLHAVRKVGNDLAAGRILERFETARLGEKRPVTVLLSEHFPELLPYYDRGERQTWLPFVMVGGPANARREAFSTDSRGYRYTVLQDGTRFSPADDPDQAGNAILSGGSTAFGVGATSDSHTIPSLLSTDALRYYNYAQRAYVLQQNTIDVLFDMHILREMEQIIILAGWNELVSIQRSIVYPAKYGALWAWNSFCRAMNPMLVHFPVDDWPAEMRSHFSTSEDRNERSAYDEMLNVTNAMLASWRMFANHLRAEPVYVLQPSPFWIDRFPSEQESRFLSAIIDIQGEHVQELQSSAKEAYREYRDELTHVCERNEIRFIDSNAAMETHPRRDAWLFIDQAHMTDVGYEVLAEIIQKGAGSDARQG